ncbi:TPA: 50S ribosomal protein L19e [Candidatus Bathyarchaeota archaeon]|nr:50S ribosomal protein L19e [Candidatus Bathyarchaeota archaeon]HIJ09014.1 50S ribosomal protein L19e [Candidatus Bathyarchaeota archaeon]
MTNLTNQRRLAAQIMKVGQNRVWIDPARTDDVESAITREEVRKLIHEKIIKSVPEKGVSRSRAKTIQEKKRKGRRKGVGSYGGSGQATITKKDAWMIKIRSLRRKIRELKTSRVITEKTYSQTYRMAGSGRFESIADLERYLKAHDLWRKR